MAWTTILGYNFYGEAKGAAAKLWERDCKIIREDKNEKL